jgi:flagellin-like protein
MKMRKGISPLVATVILIAATMSIAGILAYWTTGFIKTRLTEAESITGGTKCFGAEFELRSGSYDGNALHLILDNKKNTDLLLTNLFLIYPDNKLDTKSLNETLKGNEIKALTISNVVPDFLTGEIKTQCPDVSAFFTYSKVAG